MVAALMTAALLSIPAAALAQSAPNDALEIDVSKTQQITLIGRSTSLRAAIELLCTRADVKLLAYKADDRAFAADFSDIALSQVLERLLRAETYLVGLRKAQAGETPRVSWLMVTGSSGHGPGSNRVPEIAGNFGRPFGVPQTTLDDALGSHDTAVRGRATSTILAKIGADPSLFEEFASTDVGTAVDRLAHYPYASDFLQTLRDSRADAAEQSQIEGVISTLEFRRRTQQRASKNVDSTIEGE
jgi:hypothetical protein